LLACSGECQDDSGIEVKHRLYGILEVVVFLRIRESLPKWMDCVWAFSLPAGRELVVHGSDPGGPRWANSYDAAVSDRWLWRGAGSGDVGGFKTARSVLP
jgi:hypothetical protein